MARDLGPTPLLRCCALWLVVTGSLAPVAVALVPGLDRAPQLATLPFDEALVLACEAALLCCVAWFWGVTSIVVLDAARGRCGRQRGVPAGLRRVLLAACGATLLGSLAVPASSAPAEPSAGQRPGPAGSLVHGLPLPDRATAASHVGILVARRASILPTSARHEPTAVVRPGDTLWALAARDLSPDATGSAITRRWQQIYRINRLAIGPDPDLIHPHQRLRLPRR